MKGILGAVALMLAVPLAGMTMDFQPADEIKLAAEQAAVGTTPPEGTSAVASVDPQLRMPKCEVALSASPVNPNTVEVACGAPMAWKLYIPVKTRRMRPILVLRNSLIAGAVVTPDDVSVETRDAALSPGGVLGEQDLVAGMTLKRPLSAGAVLTANDMISARLVKRGDAVMILAKSGGLEVRAPGKALSDGGAAERVTVQNVASNRVVQGVVQGNGEVLVAL